MRYLLLIFRLVGFWIAALPASALDLTKPALPTNRDSDADNFSIESTRPRCDVCGMKGGLGGAPTAGAFAAIFRRTVDVADYRKNADGSDWGPAFRRAQAAIEALGGTIRVSTPGTLTVSTATTFRKGLPYVVLRCDSPASVIKSSASLTSPMFIVGGAPAAGGANVDVEGCTFAGASTRMSYAFKLINANAMTFRRVTFSGMSNAVSSQDGYALSFDDVVFNGVMQPVYSSTSAHNLVARRVKAYGGGTVFRLDGATNNVSISEGDFESTGAVLQVAGGSALRFTGNYVEYFTGDPVYSTAALYGADVSTNWFALSNSNWNIRNWVGGQFKGNSIYNQTVTIGAGTVDLEIGDNRVTGTSVLPTSPYQVPTLTNSWAQQANYSSIGFRKGRDGKVYLRGSLVNPTASLGTSAFTLPVGYRPGRAHNFLAGNSSGTITNIYTDGTGAIVINTAAGAGTSANPYQAGLDGISFEPGF